MGSHWVEWHRDYDDPGSALSQRRVIVTRLIGKALDDAPPGPIRVLSLCAGDSVDLADAAIGHMRADDLMGVVIELDPELAARAADNLAALPGIRVIAGDAADVSLFGKCLPVDLLLLVGVFGNISDTDIARTIFACRSLCAPGATAIWTRHRRPPDITPQIRTWFDQVPANSLAFESAGEGKFAVGVERISDDQPASQLPNDTTRLFTFLTGT